MVNPVTVIGLAAPVAVCTIGSVGLELLTLYLVMGLPPSEAGGAKLTVACALPATALTPVGAPGTVGALGVTLLHGADAGPFPIALTALALKV